jgi:hypothetical protein
MKKIKTRLQLTKTTVRVLGSAELEAVRGGGVAGRISSADPNACVHGRISSGDPNACVANQ